ncbi:MAG TPA: EAL domain-containing protein [Gammaproteobacteria bacterium]
MTDSIIPPPGRYQAEHFGGGYVDGTVASKYSEATKISAVHQVLVEGRSPKDVADLNQINLSTLRRWLKDAAPVTPTPPAQTVTAPACARLVILDSEDSRGKLERILHNEGFSPRFEALRGHALCAEWRDFPIWLDSAWLIELPPPGAQRLLSLIERSGKDIPVAWLDACAAPGNDALLDHEPVRADGKSIPGALAQALGRLHARHLQRAQLRMQMSTQLDDCQRHFDQLQRCCLRAFDNTPNPIAIVRAGGHIYANPAYLRMFADGNFATLQDTAPESLLAEADRPALAQSLAAALDNGQTDALDLVLHNGLRVRAELERFPGSSRGVQLILQPYAQVPVQLAEKPRAPVTSAVAEQPQGECPGDTHALWEERIRRALRERHLFSIVYQPIVSLGGVTEACYEALLRLHDEQGGEYLPASFLPAAERAGLMGVVDQWVIRQAARQVQSEWVAGRTVRVFVNLSRATLLNPDFSAWLARLFEHFRIAPEAFVFEVPESVLMLHLLQCRTALHALRGLGCGIALDHFGGGADVFDVLHDTELDYLKFDAALTRGLADSHEIQLRVRDLAGRAHAQNKQVVAGRVQDARSVALLWQSGVDYVQGYFLQQPSRALDYDFVNGDYEVATSGHSGF